jgi:hypothetical protein
MSETTSAKKNEIVHKSRPSKARALPELWYFDRVSVRLGNGKQIAGKSAFGVDMTERLI